MPNTLIQIIKKRSDFKAAAQTGMRWVTPGFILQVNKRSSEGPTRYGITASRKVGNAVIRNFTKRRFRTLLRLVLPSLACSGTDYILIARSEAKNRSFALMAQELEKALKHLQRNPDRK